MRTLIERGVWAEGDRLPTESVLAKRFGVNRLTLRHALAELARSGLVVAKQGVGTFVAERPKPILVELGASHWAAEQDRGARALEDEGRSHDELLLDVALVEAKGEAAEHLGPTRMLWIEALHRIDDRPVIRTQYWCRSALSPADVRHRAAQGGFGHRLMREVVGAEMYYAWRSFDAIAASRRDSVVLDVPVGSPLLHRCGVNSDVTGRPVLYLERDAPSGRMRIVMNSAPPQV